MKKILLILIALMITSSALTIVSAGEFDFVEDYSQSYDDYSLYEDIGGDGVLIFNYTFHKLDEQNIPDGSFKDSDRNEVIHWKNAKNISFIDEMGLDGYVVVWKASPEDYNLTGQSDSDLYMSGYTFNNQELYFLEYSKDKNAVYGVYLDNHNQLFYLSDLAYDMLGFNESQMDVYMDSYENSWSDHSPSSSIYSGGSSHYGGVDTSPYTVAKNDPGAYYDYYEYGDNYEIDDYLESQGFD